MNGLNDSGKMLFRNGMIGLFGSLLLTLHLSQNSARASHFVVDNRWINILTKKQEPWHKERVEVLPEAVRRRPSSVLER